MSDYPYQDRFPVQRTLPEHGRPRADILAELATMAKEEDAFWETGKCSGTMYCGDHDHYDFLAEAFGLYAHVNALQRDMCPSSTRFEGEIIAMALDLFHAEAITDSEAAGHDHQRRHRQHLPRHARLPRARCRPRRDPPQRHQARDRAPRVRQGLPPLRHRAAGRAGRPRHHHRRPRLGRRQHRRPDGRPGRLGLQLRLRHHRPHRRPGPARPPARHRPPRRRLPRRLGCCPSARSSATTSRCSTSASPASPPSPPTPTSTATP